MDKLIIEEHQMVEKKRLFDVFYLHKIIREKNKSSYEAYEKFKRLRNAIDCTLRAVLG